jgi:hypothetical protein
MKMKNFLIVLLVALISVAANIYGQSKDGTALTESQQKAFLSQRLESGGMTGTFNSFGSLLYSFHDVAIHTDNREIGAVKLSSSFPPFYKPTWKEMLDAIAIQTRSSWKYDSKRNFWVFAKPAIAKPYTITLADKWTAEDRGTYVSYKPPTFPVGMDIYYFGVYSADKEKEQTALWRKIRDAWAVRFASSFKKDITVDEMQKTKVSEADAVYLQTPTLPRGVVWRQWALVKNGHTFVIVSTLRPEDKQLVADVEAMVKSFRVVP